MGPWALTAALVAGAWAGLRLALVTTLWVMHLRFMAYLRFKGRRSPLRGFALLGYWWREASAMVRVGRYQLWGRLFAPRDGQGPGRPVVLAHGFTQNRTNWLPLRRHLEEHGRPTYAPDLGLPFLGDDVARYVPALENALETALAAHPGEGVDIVAHSMGGLVTRLALRERPDLAAEVRTVVTLGSPHAGTASARGLRFLGEGWHMRRSSPLFKDLPSLPELLPHARVVTVAALVDYVVYPVETCHVPGADNLTFERPGHTGLLVDEEVLGATVDALCGEAEAEREGMAPSGANG